MGGDSIDTIRVSSRQGDYPIHFLSSIAELDSSGFLMTDSNLAKLYPDLVNRFPHRLVVEAGETSKDAAVCIQAWNEMARLGLKRADSVIAFGGGVVGDLAGFVAASYMRGVAFVQVPTTLLAMVDSSVGGKVGINLPTAKNSVGAFYSPSKVLVCIDFLKTLPQREFISGTAECWKYAYIMKPSLRELIGGINKDSKNLEAVIRECIQCKKAVVEEDELETTGRRAILNFGHTIGHALETVTEYKKYLHGEAIAIGMVAEAKLGEHLGISQPGITRMIESDMMAQDLPTALPNDISRQELLDAMRKDKKNLNSGVGFSFIEVLGTCKLSPEIELSAVKSWLDKV